MAIDTMGLRFERNNPMQVTNRPPQQLSASTNAASMKAMRWGVFSSLMLFILCEAWAMIRYPGGNFQNQHEHGYDFFANYWCDLFAANAVNTTPNLGRTPALIGAAFLILALLLYWSLLAKRFETKPKLARSLQALGTLGAIASLTVPLTAGISVLHHSASLSAGALSVSALVLASHLNARLGEKGVAGLGYAAVAGVSMALISYDLSYRGWIRESLWLPASHKVILLLILIWILTNTHRASPTGPKAKPKQRVSTPH